MMTGLADSSGHSPEGCLLPCPCPQALEALLPCPVVDNDTIPSQLMFSLGKVISTKTLVRPLQPCSERVQEMKRLLRQVAQFCASSASHSEANPLNLCRIIGSAVTVKHQYPGARRTQQWPLKRLARQANTRRSKVSGVLLSSMLVLKLHSGTHVFSDFQRPNGMSK